MQPMQQGQFLTEEYFSSISLNNTGVNERYVFLHGTIESQQDGIIFDGFSAVFALPPGTSFVQALPVEPINADYDPAYEEIFISTGSLLAGTYILCMQVIDAETEIPLNEDCIEHMVEHPMPPELITPQSGEEVTEPYPVFTWTPPSPLPEQMVFYDITITQVYGDQAPLEALESNPAWYTNNGLMENALVYSMENRPFEDYNKYVWQVQAIGEDGTTIGQNNGRSEIGSFVYLGGAQAGQLSFIRPEPGENINTENFTFEWTPVENTEVVYDFSMKLLPEEIFENFDSYILDDPYLTNFETVVFIEGLMSSSIPVADVAGQLEPGNHYAASVVAKVNDQQVAESDKTPCSFMGETQGCDTTEVNLVIEATLEGMNDTICGDAAALMDSLLAAIDDYEDAMWELDEKTGIKDAHELFSKMIQDLKDAATGAIQDQLDNVNNLNANDNSCAPNWKSDFYSRYVAPNPTRQRQQVYKRYVQRYENYFERCKDREANRLEDDLGGEEDYYDDLQSDLDELVPDIADEIQGAEDKAADAKAKMASTMNQLTNLLCEVDVKWNTLIQFMNDNIVCVRCGEAHIQTPDQVASLDSCLKALFDNLQDRINDIRYPADFTALNNQAKDKLDMDDFDDLLDQLNDKQDEYDQLIANLNANTGKASLVHKCCERFYELASGVRMYAGGVKNYSHSNGKGYGLGNNSGLIIMPRNPWQYGKDDDYHDDFRDEKRDIRGQAYDLRKEINSLLGKLSRRGYVNDLDEEEALEAHAKALTQQNHQKHADELKDMLENLMRNMSDCFAPNDNENNRRIYIEINHRCWEFKECLEALDALYHRLRNQINDEGTRLGNEIAELENREERLREKLELLKAQRDAYRSIISDLTTKLQKLGYQSDPSLNDEINQARQDLRKRIAELEKAVNQAMEQINRIIGELDNLKDRLDNLNEDLEDWKEIVDPRPIASLVDCDEMRRRLRNLQNERAADMQEMGGEADNINDQIGEAESDTDEAERDLRNAAEEGRDIADEIGERDQEFIDETNRLRIRELTLKKLTCARLLAEYMDEAEVEGSVFEDISEIYEFVQDQADEIPDRLSGATDKFKDFMGKIEENRQQLEEALNVLEGVLNNDDLEARQEAFGSLLNLVKILGDKVPGVGEMLGFYASAYDAAIDAIMALEDQIKIDPIRKVIDKTPIRCTPELWGDKSFDEILDEKWEDFKDDNSIILNNISNQSTMDKLEEYFKQRAMLEIYKCCLETMMIEQSDVIIQERDNR